MEKNQSILIDVNLGNNDEDKISVRTFDGDRQTLIDLSYADVLNLIVTLSNAKDGLFTKERIRTQIVNGKVINSYKPNLGVIPE